MSVSWAMPNFKQRMKCLVQGLVPGSSLILCITLCPCTEVIKIFSRSTQLCVEFLLLIKTKMLKIKTFLAFKRSDVVFTMIINVKTPTIVGILTIMGTINVMLTWVEHEKGCITLGPGHNVMPQMRLEHGTTGFHFEHYHGPYLQDTDKDYVFFWSRNHSSM